MAENKKIIICEYAYSALHDFASFAKFVSYAENLDQVEELFQNENCRKNYQHIWFELEIINASALSDWEDEGRPVDWKNYWESHYKQDSTELVNKLIAVLK
ncbi:hypothetical protein ABK905_25360 [Acerihabitans sp. KWT182]|uniref:CdiI immunity protein domain-containing protein n=1 Tax=Acerihabitans sp. KWT182 TaxID=3157919 RepID=A0AAU7QBL3_9GAMM